MNLEKNVLITGATGMIGDLVLKECLESEKVERVTSIVRRISGIIHPKLTEIIHNDFLDFTSIKNHFTDQDIAYFCLGVYTGAVPRERFREITIGYTKSFATTLKEQSSGASFVFLSGAGADTSEKSRVAFARDKGIAENFLIKQNFRGLYLFRPAYIYPVSPRKEPNFTYRISRALYPLIKLIYPNGVIPSNQLAKAMFIAGLNGHEKTTLENKDIRKMVGLA